MITVVVRNLLHATNSRLNEWTTYNILASYIRSGSDWWADICNHTLCAVSMMVATAESTTPITNKRFFMDDKNLEQNRRYSLVTAEVDNNAAPLILFYHTGICKLQFEKYCKRFIISGDLVNSNGPCICPCNPKQCRHCFNTNVILCPNRPRPINEMAICTNFVCGFFMFSDPIKCVVLFVYRVRIRHPDRSLWLKFEPYTYIFEITFSWNDASSVRLSGINY